MVRISSWWKWQQRASKCFYTQTATKVTKHGMHQDNPGLATSNTHNSSVQAGAFPVLILHVVECWRIMPIIGHTRKSNSYWWLLSILSCPTTQVFAVPRCKKVAGTWLQRAAWLLTGRSLPSFAEMLQNWLLAHRMGRMVWADCWAACISYAFVPQAEWEVFLWNLHVFTQVLVPVILALIFVFWGRDSTSWYTDALSELKSWQILPIIFARAPQGRQATLSRCGSNFLAY